MDNKTVFSKEALESVMKQLEEQQLNSSLQSRKIIMGARTYDQWVKSMPEGFTPDKRFIRDPFLQEGKVYGVPDEMLHVKFARAEVVFDRIKLEEISRIQHNISWHMHHFYGMGAYPARKPKKWTEDNPNWSIEWDDWRNREDYKEWAIYRTAMRFIYWLLRRKMPVKSAAPANNMPLHIHIEV